MKSTKVILSVVAAVMVAAGIICWLMFGGVGPLHVALDSGVQAKFTATMKNTEISREKDGKMVWKFKVAEVNNDQVTNKVLLHGITGKVYRDDGSYIDVTAAEGEMKNGSQDFLVKNGVSAVLSSDNSKISADQVTWRNKDQRITATGHVQFWKDEWYARGDKAVTTSSFKKIRLIGHGYMERREKK